VRQLIDVLKLFVLLPLVAVCAYGCEGCLKDYMISGTVADADFNPIADVQVSLDSSVLTTTDINGHYFARYPSEREGMGHLSGKSLIFIKAGYQTVEATAFNIAEAGPFYCDTAIGLQRDAVLQPE
jgi:hypothetical protein